MMTRSQQRWSIPSPGDRQPHRGASIHATSGRALSHYPPRLLRTRIWNSETGVRPPSMMMMLVVHADTRNSLAGPDLSMVTHSATNGHDDREARPEFDT